MIGSSQVDLVCWTERVCRDCREALTTVTLEEPAGSRNVQRSRGATGCRLFRDLRQLSGEPMPDPSMTAAAASHWQRYDFRCGSKGDIRPREGRVCFTRRIYGLNSDIELGPKSANPGSAHHSIELKANSESRQNQTTSPRRAGNLKAVQCNLLEGASGRTIRRKSSSLIS
jgi:hypothetical protein